jgi:hypothetical protein
MLIPLYIYFAFILVLFGFCGWLGSDLPKTINKKPDDSEPSFFRRPYYICMYVPTKQIKGRGMAFMVGPGPHSFPVVGYDPPRCRELKRLASAILADQT